MLRPSLQVGAARYREMRWAGQTSLPAPILLPQALSINIPSREPEREIPCRLLYPQSRTTAEARRAGKGVLVHFHGGGWVLGDERSLDGLLQFYADAGDLVVVSVGYRLAPEDPFPKGPEDCVDAGEYLLKNAESLYGASVKFIAGDSAGAHLALLTTFHLLKTHPEVVLAGLVLHYGCFDLSELPSVKNFEKNLILNRKTMDKFLSAFLPHHTPDQRKVGSISPYYENLEPLRGRLPSALFTIGTEDLLVDDTVAMATKWMMFGGEAIVRVFPGCPHGFIGFPAEVLKEAGDVLQDTKAFLEERVGQA
ncbi:hypothetical protein QTJ16_000923 [Diplocarpon rosae]|uniref:Alpha/beta hydrolase fold-3 domain-containing protein n=1 Tax=Diplocarpon rosae TaxID=946125 RepID=A0AAD9T715_9HELO|nr:hypothetical protein QTJ16_000923 [Diplocarpon rosae]